MTTASCASCDGFMEVTLPVHQCSSSSSEVSDPDLPCVMTLSVGISSSRHVDGRDVGFTGRQPPEQFSLRMAFQFFDYIWWSEFAIIKWMSHILLSGPYTGLLAVSSSFISGRCKYRPWKWSSMARTCTRPMFILLLVLNEYRLLC